MIGCERWQEGDTAVNRKWMVFVFHLKLIVRTNRSAVRNPPQICWMWGDRSIDLEPKRRISEIQNTKCCLIAYFNKADSCGKK